MNWYYDEPMDELAVYNRRVVYSETMILAEHLSDELGLEWLYGEEEINETTIEDWVIGCWAAPTDMPVGEYITLNKRS